MTNTLSKWVAPHIQLWVDEQQTSDIHVKYKLMEREISPVLTERKEGSNYENCMFKKSKDLGAIEHGPFESEDELREKFEEKCSQYMRGIFPEKVDVLCIRKKINADLDLELRMVEDRKTPRRYRICEVSKNGIRIIEVLEPVAMREFEDYISELKPEDIS